MYTHYYLEPKTKSPGSDPLVSRFGFQRLVRSLFRGLAAALIFGSSANAQTLSDDLRQEPWLRLEPREYGTRVLQSAASDANPVIALVGGFGPIERLAALPPLRLEPNDPPSASLVQPASFEETGVFGSASSLGMSVTSSLQEEIDNRQPLSLSSSFEEMVKRLHEDLNQVDAKLGTDRAVDWNDRIKTAREAIAIVQSSWVEAQKWSASVLAAPKRVVELQQLMSQPQLLTVTQSAPRTAAESQSMLDAAKKAFQQQKHDLERLQNLLGQREQIQTNLETELAGLRQKLAEFAIIPAAIDESPTALMTQLESRLRLLALRAELLQCEERLSFQQATDELNQLERNVAQRQLTERQSLVESLEQKAEELRQIEVQQQAAQAEQAQREAAKVDLRARSLAELAEINSRLVSSRLELAEKLKSLDAEMSSAAESAEKVKLTREQLQERIKNAGVNQNIGALMLVHRRELPNISSTARRKRQVDIEIPQMNSSRMDLIDRRDEIADVAGVVKARLLQLATVDNVEITDEIRTAVKELIKTHQDLIQDLIEDVNRYIEQLNQFSDASAELIKQTRESQTFVDEKVLWIRSTDPLNRTDVGKFVSAFSAVIRSLQPEVANFDWKIASRRWSQYAIWAFLIFLVGVVTRKRLKTILAATSEEVAQSSSRRLAVVCKMIVLVLLVSAFWPAIYWGVGQYLSSDSFDITSVAGSLGKALMSVVPFVALACVMRQLTLRDGFAEKYLAWQPATIRAVHRSIRWYLLSVLPLRGAGVFFDHFQDGRWASSAGRSMFILSQIALFICLNIAIRQVSNAMLSMGQPGTRGFWLRTRRIWGAAIVLAPLLLAGLSMIGYHYSASELSYRFGWTVWLILSATALVSLAQQIAQIVLNKIAVRRFWQDRAQEAEHATGEPNEEFDTEKIGHQISRLLRGFTFAGVVLSSFLIWSQVLPAVQVLDQVKIWNVPIEVVENVVDAQNKPVSNADGSPKTTTVTTVRQITLADLVWAAVCLALTVVLSRNLPGLLEVTLLDRLPLDRGGKYAISVVCRYFVAIAGCVLAARHLGFEWSSVQWLVAAMSVGLGFGLQEIFGNFVSGMIILLERPIRVGDLVTVNGTTGYVTRIQLRATTITDADRREMIVPNKKFITDDVINWTLTDPITRMVIPVGIAYGSDTDLACATMLEVARQNRHVMQDPGPNVVFTRFGASSLDLELRVYLPNREHFPDVQHELHLAIDRVFREKQIEIAFPQQDIHIRPSDSMAKALLQARHEVKQQTRKQDAA